MQPPTDWHVHAFTDQCATGQHFEPPGAEILQQLPACAGIHRAVNTGRGNAIADWKSAATASACATLQQNAIAVCPGRCLR
jgi:hypothetical protein